MFRRSLPLAALLALFTAAVPARAAEEEASPSIIVRLRSIDGLREDARYLVTLLGKGEEAKQVDEFIKSMMGQDGLKGIDVKKPLGFYGTVGPNGVDSTGVLMLPIADEKAFLSLLQKFDLKLEKPVAGLYSFAVPNSQETVYFRFANDYVYATIREKTAVAKEKLLEPASVLPTNITSAASVTVRFDKIPNEIKQLFLQQMALKIADAKNAKLPDETDAQQTFRAAILDDFSKRTKQLLSEGSGLTLRFNIDRKTEEVTVDASLTGKAQSKLAEDIADLGKSKSLFAGAIGTDSALSFLLHVGLPAELRKAMDPVIDEGMKAALEKEKDEAKRALAEKFLAALAPTLKMGEVDTLVNLTGPTKDGKYAMVFGFKIADGVALEKSFRGLVKELKPQEQEKIKFDVEKVGNINIHMLDVKKELDAKATKLFGENQVYMAFRNDAWFLAGGAGGLELLKQTLGAKAKEGPQFSFDMSVKRLAPALEASNPMAGKIIEDVFKGEGTDKIHVAVEGGKSLRAHFTIKTSVVKFFADLGRAQRAPEKE